MGEKTAEFTSIGCHTEYEPLRKVILCSPQFMHIREVINETQVHYVDENIDRPIAMQQHNSLIETLQQEGVEVILLPPEKDLPEQVFTRDIAFTYGQQVIVGQLDREIRQGEEEILIKWLTKEAIPFVNIQSGGFECGDVIIDGKRIWVGDSYRTSREAIQELRDFLPDIKIIPISFNGDYLHLDCVFNIISEDEGLVFPPAFESKYLARLKDNFDLIEVSREEQFTLGTNVISLGNKKVISLPINRHVNNELRKRGYRVIEVDISEIIKSGGSFRCITMPLLREN